MESAWVSLEKPPCIREGFSNGVRVIEQGCCSCQCCYHSGREHYFADDMVTEFVTEGNCTFAARREGYRAEVIAEALGVTRTEVCCGASCGSEFGAQKREEGGDNKK
ncbi:MAG: hypothetical protein EHM79_06415 [Geobacter sp.]|nr:MAG: hypothetical protein EHM79_06415 [Geobacter sp.]